VDRNPNGASLIGDGPGDGLTYPPRGVGTEFITSLIFEFIHGFHQANIPLLNQI
jgi:hypothetical protein